MEDPRYNMPPVPAQDEPPDAPELALPPAPPPASDNALPELAVTFDAPEADALSAPTPPPQRPFETLTLGEALTSLRRRPLETWDALWRTVDGGAAAKRKPILAPADALATDIMPAVPQGAEAGRPGAIVRQNRLLTGLRGGGLLAQLTFIVLVAILGAIFTDDVAGRVGNAVPVTIWLLVCGVRPDARVHLTQRDLPAPESAQT